MLKGI